MAQNPFPSTSRVTIKLEPTDSSQVCACMPDSYTNVSQCTCGQRSVSSSTCSKTSRDVLVNFGLNRKKVITLKSKEDNLQNLFCAYMLQEPAFSKLLDDSYIVFQEFNAKFGTWVDVDESGNLSDGAVVNAVFFPKMIEREDGDPSSVKLKKVRKERIKQEKVEFKKKVVEIDLSSDSETSSNSTESDSTCQSDDRKRKKHNKKKKSVSNDTTDSETHASETHAHAHAKDAKKKKNEQIENTEKCNKKKTKETYGDELGNYSQTVSEFSTKICNSKSPMAIKQNALGSTAPISTSSSSHAKLRQNHKNNANMSLQADANRKNCNNLRTSRVSGSHLEGALSVNKKLDAERKRLTSGHHSGGREYDRSYYDPRDPEIILNEHLTEEWEKLPMWITTSDKGKNFCKGRVKGITFYANGKTRLIAKLKAVAKAINFFYPHVRFKPVPDDEYDYLRFK